MTNHGNRGRISVTPLGTDYWSRPWALRVNPIPKGAKLLAQITVGADRGLLIQFERTGSFAMLIGGCIRNVPHNKVVAALANAAL
jgi:hypothetical protein